MTSGYPEQTCRCGKTCYSTKQAAAGSAVRRLRPRADNPPARLRVYRCPEGNGFHLTADRKAKRS